MLYPLFIIGGVWFYSLLIIESILLMWCLEKDEPWFANGCIIIFFAALWILGDFNIFAWLKNNPDKFIMNGIAYVLIGLIYSVLKYTLYLTDKKRKYDKVLNEFFKEYGITSIDRIPECNRNTCADKLERVRLPDFVDSTKSIIFWMMYWPWSAVWTLLNNPIKWIFEEVYEIMSGLFRRIHEKIIGKRQKQLKAIRYGNGINK